MDHRVYDLGSNHNISFHTVPNVDSHIVLSLTLVKRQKTAFSRQMYRKAHLENSLFSLARKILK